MAITRRGLIGSAAAGTAITVMPSAASAAPKQPSARSADVVVVGAGLAGLTAARRGGCEAGARCWCSRRATASAAACSAIRCRAAPTPSSAGCSPGRPRTTSRRSRRDVGVGLYPTYNTGNNVFVGGDGRREEFPSDTPLGTAPADPVVAPDIALAVTQLDEMAKQVPVDAPWSSPHAEEWDRQTLDTWLRAHTSGNPEFMAVTSAATEAIFGCEPGELSLLYTVFYLAASGNEENQGTFERNFNTKDGAQERRFAGGTHLIPQRVARSSGIASS